jgi:hypothetical protein
VVSEHITKHHGTWMFSQGSDEALPVTGRRAKRENGGLGEDPPGSTITRQQVLRTWKFRKWKAGAKRANVRCPGSLFEGQKRLARGQKIFDCQFSEPVLFPYPTSYAFSGGSGQSRFASLSSGVFFPRRGGGGKPPNPSELGSLAFFVRLVMCWSGLVIMLIQWMNFRWVKKRSEIQATIQLPYCCRPGRSPYEGPSGASPGGIWGVWGILPGNDVDPIRGLRESPGNFNDVTRYEGPGESVSKSSCFLGDPPPDPRFLASLRMLSLAQLLNCLD